MSIDRKMEKEDVIHTYNEILLSHKKEWMPFAATWMNTDYHTKWSKPSKDKYPMTLWHCLYVESKKKKKSKWTYLQNRNWLTDIEKKFMVTKGERGGGIN